MVAIIDYGMGNLRSVAKACEKLGYEVSVQKDLKGASKAILPGVGAFRQAVENLAGIKDDLVQWCVDGQPLLGICLGQQLLMESSEEFGESAGLGVIGGKTKYLPKDAGLKVPHMGWSPVAPVQRGLFEGVEEGSRVFFVHSLYTEVSDEGDVAAWTDYGVRFPSALQHGNVWATQFHPEKSSTVGLKILENFLAW